MTNLELCDLGETRVYRLESVVFSKNLPEPYPLVSMPVGLMQA